MSPFNITNLAVQEAVGAVSLAVVAVWCFRTGRSAQRDPCRTTFFTDTVGLRLTRWLYGESIAERERRKLQDPQRIKSLGKWCILTGFWALAGSILQLVVLGVHLAGVL